MCIGVPSKVVSLSDDNLSAVVESKNGQQTVSLLMMDSGVQVGDYLLIQVGGFAVDKMDSEEALKAIELIKAIEHGDIERAIELY
ncbi:hydrogenase assembly protein HypC [Vibrio sp. MACH09]|uniref:HypC/HybG/HupF family hydrogenase formation chaperone n=1 Tax=unclassified Vibrio TaxID=2614977 RepID=UPI001493BE53|nr:MULTISPECIES: HypC/HybG/HupF family hydrogenase formation chaperone [unclassified Vibrio]NOI68680.1 HypC/HybG/HupF family hydrogenase formation chaperone [Vibrio sp. 99-8-1]GLO62251.1 hydrogenase assembly protein HypC [Vibrio sp. MACH09]